MAIRKASNSNIQGDRYADASAGTSKIADIPDQPTSIVMSSAGGTVPTATVVAATTGGTTNDYKITANPGGAFTTGMSPVDLTYLVNNGITPDSTYTFTATPRNVDAKEGPVSAASSAYTVPNPKYALLQNYTSSTTFTVPTGITRLAVVVMNGGSSGSGPSGDNGGAGGNGGAAYGFQEQAVTAGQQYSVTIGGAGGTTSFGDLLTSGTGSGNATTKIAGSGAGNGGNAGTGYGNFGCCSNQFGVSGGNGNTGNVVLSGTGWTSTTTVPYGGGGSGGGSSGRYTVGGGNLGTIAYGGGGGGTPGTYGGYGGYGGGWNTCYYNCGHSNSGGGGNAGDFGGGGGGGAGGRGGVARGGGGGRVIIYGR